MSINLDLSQTEEPTPGMAEVLPASYLEAVNAARFVKGFGIAAVVNALLLYTGISLLGAGIGIGIGIFIFKYDNQKYYRVLGVLVIVLAVLLPITFLSPLVLSAGVLWRGKGVLNTLKTEGRADEDWEPSRKRAIVGTVASGVGLFISVVFLVLVVLGLLSQLARNGIS